jgi:tRNA-specific 2-thiouridylase
MNKSVLVAVSGGLDSTITSLLLKQKGFSVTGIHFNLYNPTAIDYKNELKEISEKLQIPIVELDISEEFRNTVIEYFSTEYSSGRTPCPCSFCNVNIKFKVLYNYAVDNGFDKIATGHYVRQTLENSITRFRRGVDAAKDQSYFLWGVDPKYIIKTITPLGDFTKNEVRAIARQNGFDSLASKKESMGVCFLKGNNYRDFLREDSIFKNQAGKIIDEIGNTIGEHDGIQNYTVGQKKGLQNLPKNYCVTNLIADQNTIVIGKWDSLYYNNLQLINCKLPSLSEGLHEDLNLMVRGFGKNPDGKCSIVLKSNNEAVVQLSNAAWAPMEGQPVVIYKEDILLGGGYLSTASNNSQKLT